MRVVVTGAAGFIGSTLVDSLLADGHQVLGIDSFTDYYDVTAKRANLGRATMHPRFELCTLDLADENLDWLVDGADVVYHLAGQPGVRLSWSSAFAIYERRNVLATQRLLEAISTAPSPPRRLVYASSSSVYGNAQTYPTAETALPRPHSPYGVTKLAGEHLCALYAANRGVHAVALRYFTVYGPRQRPDMAMHRLIESALAGESFPLFGDGDQVRDFTFVGDVVAATKAAAQFDVEPGTVFNVSGGGSASMREVLQLVEDLAGVSVNVEIHAPQPGDVQRTGGDTTLAASALGWRPATDLSRGLQAQVEWHGDRRAFALPAS